MNLRELRKEKGWSQGDLSNLTGLSARTSSTVLKTAGRGDRKEERGKKREDILLFSPSFSHH